MSSALEQMKQRDAQASQASTQVMASLLAAVEAQNDRIDRLSSNLSAVSTRVSELDASITQLCDSTPSDGMPSDSNVSAQVASELRQIEQTLVVLTGAIDGEQIRQATSKLSSAASTIEKTTAWNSEKAEEFVASYGVVRKHAVNSVNEVRKRAVAAIEDTATASTQQVTARLDEAADRAERLIAVAEKLGRALTWDGVGRVCVAAIPIALGLLAISIPTGAMGWMLGVGPLYAWAWTSFDTASLWWQKALIAVGAISVTGLIIAGVLWLSNKLRDTYRGW